MSRFRTTGAGARGLRLAAWVAGLVIGAGAAPLLAATLAPPDQTQEDERLITIKARAFEPDVIRLHAGQKTRLVLRNRDAELHAFVPVGLFAGLHVNVGGNGAPEFGPDGFRRVIIPSEGEAVFRFVPEKPGAYPFSCDMPGHDMKAVIVVE